MQWLKRAWAGEVQLWRVVIYGSIVASGLFASIIMLACVTFYHRETMYFGQWKDGPKVIDPFVAYAWKLREAAALLAALEVVCGGFLLVVLGRCIARVGKGLSGYLTQFTAQVPAFFLILIPFLCTLFMDAALNFCPEKIYYNPAYFHGRRAVYTGAQSTLGKAIYGITGDAIDSCALDAGVGDPDYLMTPMRMLCILKISDPMH